MVALLAHSAAVMISMGPARGPPAASSRLAHVRMIHDFAGDQPASAWQSVLPPGWKGKAVSPSENNFNWATNDAGGRGVVGPAEVAQRNAASRVSAPNFDQVRRQRAPPQRPVAPPDPNGENSLDWATSDSDGRAFGGPRTEAQQAQRDVEARLRALETDQRRQQAARPRPPPAAPNDGNSLDWATSDDRGREGGIARGSRGIDAFNEGGGAPRAQPRVMSVPDQVKITAAQGRPSSMEFVDTLVTGASSSMGFAHGSVGPRHVAQRLDQERMQAAGVGRRRRPPPPMVDPRADPRGEPPPIDPYVVEMLTPPIDPRNNEPLRQQAKMALEAIDMRARELARADIDAYFAEEIDEAELRRRKASARERASAEYAAGERAAAGHPLALLEKAYVKAEKAHAAATIAREAAEQALTMAQQALETAVKFEDEASDKVADAMKAIDAHEKREGGGQGGGQGAEGAPPAA